MSEHAAPSVGPVQETAQAPAAARVRESVTQWSSALLSRGTAVPAILSLLVVTVFFQTQSEFFLSPTNLSNLAVQATLVAVIALGEVVVLLLAEIDLSLGSVSGATAAILGVLIGTADLPWFVAVVIMLACGAAMGAVQGAWISWLGIPSFVVTLAGMLAFLGLQLYILGPQGTMSIFDPNIAALTETAVPATIGWILAAIAVAGVALTVVRRARGAFELRSLGLPIVVAGLVVGVVALFNASRGIPTALLVLVGLLILGWWITEHTRPGRHLFAVGGNAEAARRAGIAVKRIRFAAFTVAGTLGAVGGLLAASYNGSAGTLTGGGTLLLEAIGAAVIGGTSLFGGRGTVWSALFGSLIMAGVANGLDLTNSTQPVKYMVQGVIVLLAVSSDTILRRRKITGRQVGGVRV